MKGFIFVLMLLVVTLTYVSAVNLKPRITNGLTAKDGQINFQVGLESIITPDNVIWCGGSLISPEWIVTAARCTEGAQSISAYLGSTHKRSGTRAEVLQTIIHRKWNDKTIANDISLLRIAPVTLGPNINTVQLPSLSSTILFPLYLDEEVIASGWGDINDEKESTEELQYAHMKIISNSDCRKTYGSLVTSTNICAQGEMGTAPCTGDAGGPLVTESTNTLIGLTSFGVADSCTLGFPKAFTRISSYRTWIYEQTGV